MNKQQQQQQRTKKKKKTMTRSLIKLQATLDRSGVRQRMRNRLLKEKIYGERWMLLTRIQRERAIWCRADRLFDDEAIMEYQQQRRMDVLDVPLTRAFLTEYRTTGPTAHEEALEYTKQVRGEWDAAIHIEAERAIKKRDDEAAAYRLRMDTMK